MLIYVQEGSGDICKRNIMEDLKVEMLKFEIVEEFLEVIRKEFGRRDEKSKKVIELKEVRARK